MSTTETMLPPGTVFLTKILNLQKGDLINPSPQTTIKPLPPANVTAVAHGTTITVTATVYIDAADNVTSIDVYATGSLINGDTQGVYFDYNYREEIPNSLFPYTFSFTIANPSKAIKNIESFLWDEDPIGSRGTKTTVEEGGGN
ncbi:hypothetical protein [Jejuia pallidilutea]|jgi:hypothetical protein|uniref:Uncharacterized protein n=1 Tax=Jejuia pallidilutea TaxID=504487 RepID=A0A090VQ61_9FLAO|nr:hypothetical protein [Jejuia pallidilutea]GAL66875.1 hypothetical protein JCM19301_1419 [Jejuia pallidilutea]GAL70336.1 hypothetical protein JCM19302_3458 [Jejuia pallidilutea]GAL90420.1 hypothetical protein JCM19538_185 [Jejuia pallidilutea]